MSGPIAYRNAHIYVRGGKGSFMSEFSYNTSPSCRIYGGSATNYNSAVMKCKESVDAELSQKCISDYFLLGVRL